jgi:Zn-dependent protease with chaperone function
MSVSIAGGFALLLVGGAAALGRLVSMVVGRRGTSPEAVESVVGRVFRGTVAAGVVAAFVIVLRTDPGDVVTAVASSPWGSVVANAVAISVLSVAARRAFAVGVRPALDRLGTYSPPAAVRLRGDAAFAGCLFGPALLVAARVSGVLVFDPALLLPVFAVAYGLYTLLTFPSRMEPVAGVAVRDPTDAERERIEACYERFGRSPGRVVVATDSNDPAVAVAGRGSARTVGVTAPLLERVDDEGLAVALAQADERGRGHMALWMASYTALLLVFLGAVVVAVVSLVDGAVGTALRWGGFSLAALVATLPVAWLSRRAVYRADEFVASQFDSDRVAAVYRDLGAALQYVTVDPDDEYAEYFNLDPHVATRIERLGRDSATPTADQGTVSTADPLGEATATDPPGEATATERDAATENADETGSVDPALETRWQGTVRRTAVGFVLVVAVALFWNTSLVQGFPPLVRQSILAVALVAWVLMPVSIYLDSKVTRRVTGWPTTPGVYVVSACIPLVNVLVGFWYLYARPSPDTAVEPPTS